MWQMWIKHVEKMKTIPSSGKVMVNVFWGAFKKTFNDLSKDKNQCCSDWVLTHIRYRNCQMNQLRHSGYQWKTYTDRYMQRRGKYIYKNCPCQGRSLKKRVSNKNAKILQKRNINVRYSCVRELKKFI